MIMGRGDAVRTCKLATDNNCGFETNTFPQQNTPGYKLVQVTRRSKALFHLYTTAWGPELVGQGLQRKGKSRDGI